MTRPPDPPLDAPPDQADVDFEDEADRAEAQWLLAKEQDPSAPAPSEQLAAEHAELHALLSSLPEAEDDDAWQHAILKQIQSAPQVAAAPPIPSEPLVPPAPPWWRRSWIPWALAGGLAAAAALALWLQARPTSPELEVTTVSQLDRRSDEVAVGDRLVVNARPSGTADLRVFRSSGELVARCPGGPACTGSGGELRIEFILDAPGRYHVILTAGLNQPLPETGMDAYIDAARAAGAHLTVREVEAH